jgi:hypothetical protein
MNTEQQWLIGLVAKCELGNSDCHYFKDEATRMISRVPCSDRGSVIVKMWAGSGFGWALRRLFSQTQYNREIKALKRLESYKVPTPALLSHCVLNSKQHRYEYAIALEDVGICVDGMRCLKNMIDAEDEKEVVKCETRIIELTWSMVGADVLDSDHSLRNILVSHEKGLLKIDLENAHVGTPKRIKHRLLGEMIGCLVGSYVLAVQPDIERSIEFVRNLTRHARRASFDLNVAKRRVDAIIERQHREQGIRFSTNGLW